MYLYDLIVNISYYNILELVQLQYNIIELQFPIADVKTKYIILCLNYLNVCMMWLIGIFLF